MTYGDMIAAIKAAIAAHNNVAPQKIDETAVIDRIIALGGTSEDNMMQLSADDLIGCGLPPLMAKSLIKSFHAGTPAAAPAVPPSPAPAGAPAARTSLGGIQGAVVMDMATALQGSSPRDLIASYQIDNPGNVGAELVRRLTEARATQDTFLIYVGGSLDVDLSTKRYELILRGRRVTDTVMVGDVPVRPLRVGERLVEEPLWVNPLFPNDTLLEPDQMCEYTNLSWDGIGPEIRGIFILAIQSGKLQISNAEHARSLIEAAKGANGLSAIRRRYPAAAADWAALPDAAKPPLQVVDPHQQRAAGAAARAPEARRGLPFPATELPSWNGQGARVILLGAPGDVAIVDLAKHLVSAKRRGQLQFWHAGMAKGNVRGDLIAMAETADVAVLVLSADLLAMMDEDPALAVIERRHAGKDVMVLPVIARPVDIGDVRDANHSTWFGGLPRIPYGRPALSLWNNTEDGFATAASEISAALKTRPVAASVAASAPVATGPRRAAGRALVRDEIMTIHATMVKNGICGQRERFLLGLPEEVKANLPSDANNPSAKVFSDLHELAPMVLADGERPMVTWLRNAIATKPHALEAPFSVYIEALTGAPYRSPSADLYAATQR